MRTSIHQLKEMKRRGERIGMITAYDYTSARIVDDVGFPAILVGDSMSQVMLGYEDTVPLTIEESIHHTRAVVRGTTRAHIVADMPFLSYNTGWPEAVRNAGRYLKEAGAQSVKVEGGVHMVSTIRKLISAGIPVMGHIGLTPQSVNQLGGYKVQGKSPAEAQRLLTDALALQEAGVYSIVLELVPAEVAREITKALDVPTIGIGGGPHCDGQIQVLHDVLGLFEVFIPKHTRRYANMADDMRTSLGAYFSDIKDGSFPGDAESHHVSEDVVAAMRPNAGRGDEDQGDEALGADAGE